MSYQKDRERFIAAFAREFPNASMDIARALLRAATSEQRWNEIDCSIDVGESERARMEKASERRVARVTKLCESIGAKLIPNGDPRGYPFYVACPSGNCHGDWGQRGLGIPGNGLPARCFR